MVGRPLGNTASPIVHDGPCFVNHLFFLLMAFNTTTTSQSSSEGLCREGLCRERQSSWTEFLSGKSQCSYS